MRGRRSRGEFTPSGVSANTRVETLRGPVAARDLKIGDQVKTRRGGFATLRWVGTSRPLERAGTPMRRVGSDGREGTTLLAPDHLVLISHPQNDLLFGAADVLCPAKYLVASGHFVPDANVSPALVHLLFDTYELVKCGEDWVESLLPDMDQIRAEDPETADEIVEYLPRLSSRQGLASYLRTHPVLDAREARLLFG